MATDAYSTPASSVAASSAPGSGARRPRRSRGRGRQHDAVGLDAGAVAHLDAPAAAVRLDREDGAPGPDVGGGQARDHGLGQPAHAAAGDANTGGAPAGAAAVRAAAGLDEAGVLGVAGGRVELRHDRGEAE